MLGSSPVLANYGVADGTYGLTGSYEDVIGCKSPHGLLEAEEAVTASRYGDLRDLYASGQCIMLPRDSSFYRLRTPDAYKARFTKIRICMRGNSCPANDTLYTYRDQNSGWEAYYVFRSYTITR